MYTKNVLIIAKKEFSDLLSNWMMLLALIAYFLFTIYNIFNFNNEINNSALLEIFGNNNGLFAVSIFFYNLTEYGSFLGIMIGCFSISSERNGSAINTLATKPLFRDTIINGKLIGSFVFLVLTMGMAIIFYTSGIFILWGGCLSPFIYDYFSVLVVVFIFSIIYVLLFLSLSLLISIILRDQAFAMILSLIALYISYLMNNKVFAWDLSSILPGDRDFITNQIMSLSPDGMLLSVNSYIIKASIDPNSIIPFIVPYAGKLMLCAVIVIIISYILFIRRDVI